MSQTIVKTRVIPKKITENIVSRGRLLKKFEENASKSIILVMGPAGYGKTTSVLDYLNYSGKKYAWLYLNEDIDSPAAFLSYLVHSFRVLKEDFGKNTLELISSFSQSDMFSKDELNSVKAVVGSFVNEFVTDFNEDTYLVIDDLHNIEGNKWSNTVFNSLNENFPDNLHIIITTRNVPEFNMSKLTAKRRLAKIQSDELNFTADETESLLKDIYSISYKKEDVNKLLGKIEGWITGLHLILQAYGIDFPKAAGESKQIDEDIFGYFAEDIFSQLNDKTQNFLVSTSLLDNFITDICENELGITGSNEILNELVRKNLFIETSQQLSEEGETLISYSFHNLFRQFLQKKLRETKTETEVKALAEKIFKYYDKKGDFIQAVEFSLQAADYPKAAELILRNFDELLRAARHESLRRWIEQFPDEIINNNLELLFIKGKLINFFKSDTEKAAGIFNEIINKSAQKDRLYINANSEQAEIFRLTGKPDEALTIFKELYKLNAEPELKIRIIISLAKSYYRLGSKYYDDILKLLKEAEEISGSSGIENLIPDIYSLYGRIYLNKGEFVKSLHYFESILSRETNIYRKFQTLNDIVLLHSWSGEYNKAKEYYDESELIYKKYNLTHLERELIRLNALLRFEAGDYEEAIEGFLKLFSMDSKNNIRSFLLTYYLIISESYLLLNRPDKAGDYLLLAEKIRDKNDEYLSSELDSHKAILKKFTSVDAPMEKLFLLNLKNYDSASYFYNKTQVEFHLADYYFKKGNTETCLKFLFACLESSNQKSYNSFLTQHYLQYRYLFDLALVNKIHTDYIQSIHNRVIEKLQITWLSNESRKRANAELKALNDISLNTFGGVEISVRGKVIGDENWIRKKSKLLLVYLLVNQGLRIQKDKVLGIFFSELSADSADNIFHQAITNIRNALKPASPLAPTSESSAKKSAKKEGVKTDLSPSLIVYEDKILQIAQGFDYKVDVLEFNKLAALVSSPETDITQKENYAKKAIALYRGEFLPGYYDEWIEEMRSILEHKYIETCESLLEILKKKNNYEDLVNYSEKLLLTDKLHEEAFYSLVLAYKMQGNVTMAKKKHSQLLKNYEEEYGEKPPKELLQKIQTIIDKE